jgi:hypothetical protein
MITDRVQKKNMEETGGTYKKRVITDIEKLNTKDMLEKKLIKIQNYTRLIFRPSTSCIRLVSTGRTSCIFERHM